MMNLSRGRSTACKILISCRTTPPLEKLLSKKSIISLSNEKEAIEGGIRIYTYQRLHAIEYRLAQLRIDEAIINELSQKIAKKADGMFGAQLFKEKHTLT